MMVVHLLHLLEVLPVSGVVAVVANSIHTATSTTTLQLLLVFEIFYSDTSKYIRSSAALGAVLHLVVVSEKVVTSLMSL